jgi:hypothetical protein
MNIMSLEGNFDVRQGGGASDVHADGTTTIRGLGRDLRVCDFDAAGLSQDDMFVLQLHFPENFNREVLARLIVVNNLVVVGTEQNSVPVGFPIREVGEVTSSPGLFADNVAFLTNHDVRVRCCEDERPGANGARPPKGAKIPSLRPEDLSLTVRQMHAQSPKGCHADLDGPTFDSIRLIHWGR